MSRNVSILSLVGAMVVLSVLGMVTVAFAEQEEGRGGLGQDKVTLCHNGHTIRAGEPAQDAHLKHHMDMDDHLGACERTTDTCTTGTTGTTAGATTGTTDSLGTTGTTGTTTSTSTTGTTNTTGTTTTGTTSTTVGAADTTGTTTTGTTTGTTNTTGTTTGTTGNTGTCTPGDTPTKGDGRDQEKVCVLHKNKGDDHNNKGDKAYRWVSEDNKHHGEKVVKDKFCKHKNNRGEHKDNDDNAHANKNDD